MTAYQVAHLMDIDEQSDGRCPMRPVRHHFGITTFGVNGFTGREAGDRLINEHDESDLELEELYLVLQGSASFELDGDRVDAPAGTFVFVPPGVKRTAFAQEPGTTIVAIGGGAPGKPYEVEGWEIWSPLMTLFKAGEYAEVADRGRELLADDPPYAALYYNVACAESLSGRPQDAVRDLSRAIELRDEFRAMAADDSDFDPIRDEPGFQALVSGPRE